MTSYATAQSFTGPPMCCGAPMAIDPDRDEAACARCGSALSGQTGERSEQVSPVHLYDNEGCYDESSVWCGLVEYYLSRVAPTRDPNECTCTRCLSEAASYGGAALARLKALRP